jgi:hypothetical protein
MRLYLYFLGAWLGFKRLDYGLRLGLFLVVSGLFFLLFLPWYVDLAAALLFVWLCLRREKTEALLLAVALALCLAGVETATRLLARKPDNVRVFYRPDDKYWSDPAYQPGVDVEFPMPYGDLGASPDFPSWLRQPRVVRFRTDSRGFRNDAEYAGQTVILSGDSFVAGTDNDQSDTLANQLGRDYGVAAYSLGFPGTPADYFRQAAGMLPQLPDKAFFLLFVFEGNDFRLPKDAPAETPPAMRVTPNAYDCLKLRLIGATENRFTAGRLLFNLGRLVEYKFFSRNGAGYPLYAVGKGHLGFLGPYIRFACAPSLDLDAGPNRPEVMRRVRGVFFVPTKYRVYAPWCSNCADAPPSEPPAGLKALEAFFRPQGIPVVDLTPALRRRAEELLGQGRYLYWADDTHWNAAGIAVAAESVADFLAPKAKEAVP